MQSPSPARRAVGLPRNPREGHLVEVSSGSSVTGLRATAATGRTSLSPQSRPLHAGLPSAPKPTSRPSPALGAGTPDSPPSRPRTGPKLRPAASSPSLSSPSRSAARQVKAELSKGSARSTRALSPPASRDSSPTTSLTPEVTTITTPIWTSVTKFANNLTVNVGFAWSANMTTNEGEVTPLGAETRLTRAMKAYHLSKAEKLSDLPDWLFTERERRSKPVVSAGNQVIDDDHEMEKARPIYTTNYPDDRRADYNTPIPNTAKKGTPATDRLKALRARQRDASKSSQ